MKKRLFLFFAQYSYPEKDVIAATLAWVAKQSDLSFDVYYEAYHSGRHFGGPSASVDDYFGSTVLGGFHRERFYFLNAYFDVECVVYGKSTVFSSSFLEHVGANVIIETEDKMELYRKVFSHYGLRLPREAVVVETSPIQGKDTVRPKKLPYPNDNFKKFLFKLYEKAFLRTKTRLSNIINVAPYCCPEIFYRRALGFNSTSYPFDLRMAKDLTKVYTLFLDGQKVEELRNQGFDIEVIDKIQPNDTYWSITSRIANRWIRYSDGIAYCDPVLASYWLPWLCKHNKLAVYEVFMNSVRHELRDLVLSTGNKILYGRQSCDQDITELSKDDIIFQILDPAGPIFPVVEEANYRMRQPSKSYYEFEPNEETLELFAKDKRILCTILFYCPDIRHAVGLSNILELAALTKAKMGLGITAQWYNFVPEILELINVPLEAGGVFPNVEPLLCSAGMGVGVEAQGFMREETLREHLKEARRIIYETAGSKCVPKGHYPFLDTIKGYPYSKSVLNRENTSPPSFKTLADSGFNYSISYASPGKPKVIYKSDKFIAINQTSKHWLPYSPFMATSNIDEIKTVKRKLKGKPGWIIVVLDSPLWMFPYHHWEKGRTLLDLTSYITRDGETGKLVNTTPHVISRYARILDDMNVL